MELIYTNQYIKQGIGAINKNTPFGSLLKVNKSGLWERSYSTKAHGVFLLLDGYPDSKIGVLIS